MLSRLTFAQAVWQLMRPGFATGSRLAGGLLGDPGVSFVELDSAGGRDLGGEQRSSLS
jgi:hypothetical protein